MKDFIKNIKEHLRSIGVNVFSAWYNRYLVTKHERIMSKVGYQGKNVMLSLPLRLSGAQYMKIGNGVVSGPGLWMECIEKFNNIDFHPILTIGDNVRFSFDCHVGVVNKVNIGNNVLIGSKVLITDHSHGELTKQSVPYYQRDLISKGPVIIEDNCFIGVHSSILEGILVQEGAVIASGVSISASTKIINRENGNVVYGTIPPGAVVVSGSYPSKNGVNISCAVIVKQVDARTRAKSSINELLR